MSVLGYVLSSWTGYLRSELQSCPYKIMISLNCKITKKNLVTRFWNYRIVKLQHWEIKNSENTELLDNKNKLHYYSYYCFFTDELKKQITFKIINFWKLKIRNNKWWELKEEEKTYICENTNKSYTKSWKYKIVKVLNCWVSWLWNYKCLKL